MSCESARGARSPLLLARHDSALLVVDIQEKLVPMIAGKDRMLERCRLVLKAAAILKVPMLVTEQYPKGLGKTVGELSGLVPAPIEKLSFSSCGAAAVAQQLAAWGTRKALLIGMETHVCLQQTAFDLLAQGFRVYVAADAAGSRRDEDKQWALARMAAAGITVTTAEAAVFEWMETSAAPEFKEISRLIKEHDAAS